MDGRNPFRTTLKPLGTITFIGIYRGITNPGFIRWCRSPSTVWVCLKMFWLGFEGTLEDTGHFGGVTDFETHPYV